MTKQIQISEFDSPGQMIEVADDCTLSQALQVAGMQLEASERVATLNSNSLVSLNDIVSNNESYIITRNHVSG